MSQTSIIFAGIVIGWIVYITARGQLPAYLDVLGLSPNSTSVQTAQNGS